MLRPDRLINVKNAHTHTHWSEVFVMSMTDPLWEDQCEWHRMTSLRMTGPDCAVMFNLINIHTYTSDEISVDIIRTDIWAC